MSAGVIHRLILVTVVLFAAPLALAIPRECLRALGGDRELPILKTSSSHAKVDEAPSQVIESANKQFVLEVKGKQVLRKRRESKDRGGALWGDDTWGHAVVGLGFIGEPTDHARAWWLLDDGRFFTWDSRDDSQVEVRQLHLGILTRTPVVSADYSDELGCLVILHADGVGQVWDTYTLEQIPFFIPESKKPSEIRIHAGQKIARVQTEGAPLELELETGEVREVKVPEAQPKAAPPAAMPVPSGPPIAQAPASNVLEDIVWDVDGTALSGNLRLAQEYCEGHGLRLPTVRELAEEATRLGAQGIRETAYPDAETSAAALRDEIDRMARDGYVPIYKRSLHAGVAVGFYFNFRGYRKPEGSHGLWYFWSTSVDPRNSDVYMLSGYSGEIFAGDRFRSSAAIRGVRIR